MIHRSLALSFVRIAPALALVAVLSACSTSTQYPSFAIPSASEKAGRVSMRFPGVAVPTKRVRQAQPESLPAELDARLAAINARAVTANTAFSNTLAPAQRLASLAASSPIESDTWSTAQIRLAALTTHHSAAHVALAQLDRLAATAELAGSPKGDRDASEQLRASRAETASEQARLLTQISARLTP